MMKISFYALAAVCAISMAGNAFAEASGAQVFYRFGLNFMKQGRGNQVFTDTNGASGTNNDKGGWNLGAGLDLPVWKKTGPGDLLGEVMVDYAHISGEQVRQTTSALLGGTNNTKVTVAQLQVVVAPKYRFEFFDGKFRPWIIPAGVGFLVASPPSNDTTYLDVAYHMGAGAEYRFIPELSAGIDVRYNFAANEANVGNSGGTADFYLGINF
jgi:hypothetical protein